MEGSESRAQKGGGGKKPRTQQNLSVSVNRKWVSNQDPSHRAASPRATDKVNTAESDEEDINPNTVKETEEASERPQSIEADHGKEKARCSRSMTTSGQHTKNRKRRRDP